MATRRAERKVRFYQTMAFEPPDQAVIANRFKAKRCAAENSRVDEWGSDDVLNRIWSAAGHQPPPNRDYKLSVMLGSSLQRGVRLARRACPDEIEPFQRELERVCLHERIAAISRLRIDVNARYVETGELQSSRRTTRPTEEIQRPRFHVTIQSSRHSA